MPGKEIEDLVKAVDELKNKVEQELQRKRDNPGDAQLIISEVKRVGEQIAGSCKLMDSTVKTMADAVQVSCNRTEHVQKSVDYLRYAVWPSLIAIIGMIVSFWLTRIPPTP